MTAIINASIEGFDVSFDELAPANRLIMRESTYLALNCLMPTRETQDDRDQQDAAAFAQEPEEHHDGE